MTPILKLQRSFPCSPSHWHSQACHGPRYVVSTSTSHACVEVDALYIIYIVIAGSIAAVAEHTY